MSIRTRLAKLEQAMGGRQPCECLLFQTIEERPDGSLMEVLPWPRGGEKIPYVERPAICPKCGRGPEDYGNTVPSIIVRCSPVQGDACAERGQSVAVSRSKENFS